MTRPTRDRGGISVSLVLAVLAALGGGGAAVAATTVLVSNMAPPKVAGVVAGQVQQGPSSEILEYGVK